MILTVLSEQRRYSEPYSYSKYSGRRQAVLRTRINLIGIQIRTSHLASDPDPKPMLYPPKIYIELRLSKEGIFQEPQCFPKMYIELRLRKEGIFQSAFIIHCVH